MFFYPVWVRKFFNLARKIKFYLECNFFKIMNCSEICDELEINRSYASQIFSRDFGITMNKYLMNLRIDAARKLLSSPEDLKIADIARCCGFHDSGYFSRVFRRHTGKTPIEYRKKHIEVLWFFQCRSFKTAEDVRDLQWKNFKLNSLSWMVEQGS